MKEIRLLKAEEIECRPGAINEKGMNLLLFKDARVDQKLLDETFGPMGWKRSHQSIDGNLYCTVSVWDEQKNQWIDKQDVGTMGYAEKEKGQASDSFKRACFNWGIGRELYTAPFIWIPADQAKIVVRGDKYYTGERFRVSAIRYGTDREINFLTIVNGNGREVYAMETGRKERKEEMPAMPERSGREGPSAGQMTALKKELERTGVALTAVLERYHIQDAGQMTQENYRDAIKGLKRTKTREAA